MLLLAAAIWCSLLVGAGGDLRPRIKGARHHGLAPSPFGSPEAWRLATSSMAALTGVPPILPPMPIPSAHVDRTCPDGTADTPVRLDPDFVARLAEESPAVDEAQLYDLLVLTWRICREEGAHFLRTVAQIRAESDFNPRLLSRSGAMGLMQIMPDTARFMGFGDVWDPEQNLRCGVRYMKYLDRHVTMHRSPRERWVAALACYNSGPGTYGKLAARSLRSRKSVKWRDVASYYRRRFKPVPGTDAPETIIYVRRSLRSLHRLQQELFLPADGA